MVEINIKLKIADPDLNDLKLGLAKGLNIDSTTITTAWFKNFLQDMIMKYYITGKIHIARETTAPVIKDDIVEVV